MRRTVTGVAAAAAVVAMAVPALTACSSSGPSSAKTSGARTTASATPADAATTKAIARAYQALFGTSAPLAQSVAALQHGSVFRQTIISESKEPDAKGSGARVTAVNMRGADVAIVQFTVISNGKPVFPTAGKAVLVNGHWQVAAQTFCALLGLEGHAPRACADPKITALPG
jgi:hypothetical protein